MLSRFFERLAIAAILIGCLAVAGLFVATNAIGTRFMVADELNAFSIYVSSGIFQTVTYYWLELIGRVSAIFYIAFQSMLVDILSPSHYWGIVLARAFNNILIILSAAYALSIFFPAQRMHVVATLATLVYVAASDISGFRSVGGTWLLDQAIYFTALAAQFVVLAFAWRFYVRGFKRGESLAFGILLFFFLNTHELNLAGGGVILAGMLLVASIWPSKWSFPPLAPRRTIPDSRHFETYQHTGDGAFDYIFEAVFEVWRRIRQVWQEFDSPRPARPVSAVGKFFAVYAVSVGLNLLSPSLEFRAKIWPAKLPLFPDALLAGLPSAILPLEWMLGPLGLLVFACALLFGAGSQRSFDVRRVSWIALGASAFGLLALYVLLTTTLSAVIGYVVAEKSQYPKHQVIYLSLLTMFTVCLVGDVAGQCIRLDPRWARRARAAGWIAVVVVTAIVVTGTSIGDSRGFFAGPNGLLTASKPNISIFEQFLRYDRQLRDGGRGGSTFIDEAAVLAGDGPSFGHYFLPKNNGISKNYRIPEFTYIPCDLGEPKITCNGQDYRPRHEAFAFAGPGEIAAKWRNAVGVNTEAKSRTLRISEREAEGGEHYVSATFDKSYAVAAHVEIVASTPPGSVDTVGLYAISADGSALAAFDFPIPAAYRPWAMGAIAVDQSATRRADGKTVLKATFVLKGEAKTFDLRIQLIAGTTQTIYPGRPEREIEIDSAQVYIVHNGRP